MNPTVTVAHVSKSFGPVKAVQDVSFEVYPGEIFGLLGPNGAGKTTTIRMLLDIFRPDAGETTLFGGRLDEAKKKRIGYLPEERGLYKDLPLETGVMLVAARFFRADTLLSMEALNWQRLRQEWRTPTRPGSSRT